MDLNVGRNSAEKRRDIATTERTPYHIHGIYGVAVALATFLGYLLHDAPPAVETPLPPEAIRAPHKMYETEVCKILARNLDGVTEYRLDDGTRVDILTDDYAIEVDWATKWAESVGQCLYYAEKTGKRPMSLLLIEDDADDKYVWRILRAVKDTNIEVRTYDMRTKRLRKEVWVPG